MSTLIRHELGYREPVEPGEAMARTIDWLLANRPEPGGEIERQVADPFEYDAEDELVARWRAAREAFGRRTRRCRAGPPVPPSEEARRGVERRFGTAGKP